MSCIPEHCYWSRHQDRKCKYSSTLSGNSNFSGVAWRTWRGRRKRRRRGAHSLIQAKNVQKVHVLRFLKLFFSWVRMVLEIEN